MILKCPVTGAAIFADAAMLQMVLPTRITCPACFQKHLWDPHKRQFIADSDSLSNGPDRA